MTNARSPLPTDKSLQQLWYIHGKYYDLDPFLSQHPGGDFITLGRGHDCTALWESVHGGKPMPRHLLARYEVSVENPLPYLPLFLWQEDGFYRTLQHRVNDYFDSRSLNSHAPTGFFLVWAALMVTWAGSVFLGLWLGVLPFAAFAGATLQLIDHVVTHDGSHHAISKRHWINRWATHTQYLYFWATPVWMRHHVFAHHSYTGVYPLDPDLVNNVDFQRKESTSPIRLLHRVQHVSTWLYLPFLMSQVQSIMYLAAVFGNRRIFGVPFDMSRRDWLRTLLLWTFSAVVYFAIPFALLPWQTALAALACFYVAQSLVYFLTVVPNHDCLATVDNGADSVLVEQLQHAPMDWGEKQVRSTANFQIVNETLSRWLNPILGGIHYQIEHHLFPTVSHWHYPSLAPIVRATCKEFGVPYVRRGWLRSLTDFGRALRALSRQETHARP